LNENHQKEIESLRKELDEDGFFDFDEKEDEVKEKNILVGQIKSQIRKKNWINKKKVSLLLMKRMS